jgi:hypothetical protein
MSKQALYYYSENLRLIQRATFADSTGKVRGLGDNGRDLLVWLCGAANEKEGYTFYMGFQYIAEDVGIHVSNVKRLFAGFEQLGWITRTGRTVAHRGRGAANVEWRLTFYPPAAQIDATGSPTSSHMATESLVKLNTDNEHSRGKQLETETKTQPKTQTQPEAGIEQGAWGLEHDQLLAECLVCENTAGDNGQLIPWLTKQYTPIVEQALRDRPDADLVGWCVETRRQHEDKRRATERPQRVRQASVRVPQPWDNAQTSCEICSGNGYLLTYNEETRTRMTEYCDCTKQ